jgi:hypothetical protein
MNYQSNFSNNMLQTSDSSTMSSSFLTSSTNSDSFLERIKNASLTTWLIVILILAFLGFNVFAYLAEGTETVTGIFGPIVNKVTSIIAYLTGQTVNVAAEGGKTAVGVAAKGSKAVVDVAAGTAETALNVVQDIATPETAKTSIQGNTFEEQEDIMKSNALNAALNKAKHITQTGENNYEADDTLSSIQGKGKSGWCYIGEDRGFRTCAKVGVNDTCMSGEIFPTQEVCINPKLRP